MCVPLCVNVSVHMYTCVHSKWVVEICMHRNRRLFNSHPLNYMRTVTFWVFGFNQENSDSLQISICKKKKKKARHMAKGSFVPFLV